MKIIVIGSGGHAKVIIDAINKSVGNNIIGLIDDFRQKGEMTMNIPVIGKVVDVKNLTQYSFIIAVGSNHGRFSIYNKLIDLGLKYINVIHPSAIIGNEVSIGDGNFIAAGTVINSGTEIGNHCVINTAAKIDHDNHIQDFVSIAPGVSLAGNVRVERGSFVGIGSCIIEKKTIGRQTVIGAGSVVTKDVGKFKVAYGVPCKEVGLRDMRETFL